MITIPDCYRETVRHWLLKLVRWEKGPAFLGADVRGDGVCERCRVAGLELMPVVSPTFVVFALMRGDVFLAGLKMERMAADQDFVEELTQFALEALKHQ